MATLTLPGADIRGYYHRLGIHLPEHARLEGAVRCFADPAAHRREDRDPSCSVNVVNGAWQCHGCGAGGGAYDAALANGYTPRAAIDLMIDHGLIERRAQLRTGREILVDRAARSRRPTASHARTPPPEQTSSTQGFHIDERQVGRYGTALARRPSLVAKLARERAWHYEAMCELELGLDDSRITIPIRDAHGTLCGLLRYDPFGLRSPKMRAVPGTRLGLMPHPARETSEHVLLVEGPPDMVAARSLALPAIAVPSTNAWQPRWAPLLAGRRVTIIMDCDQPGRRAAQEIADTLGPVSSEVEIVDLAPDRDDGYDLTDRLLEGCVAQGQSSERILQRACGANPPPRRAASDALSGSNGG